MSVILFAKTVLEDTGVVITSTATATGFSNSRLYDRDRALLCKASAAGNFDVDIVLATADPVSAIAIVNHNQAANVEIYGDTAAAIGTTLKATVTPTGVDPFYGTFTQFSETKIRVRFLNFGSPVQAGEVLLGVPRTVTQDPYYRQSGAYTVGVVSRDRSPAGYAWAVRRGNARTRYPYGWTAMSSTDKATLESAYTECGEGSKNLLLRDISSVLKWVTWTDDVLQPTPVSGKLFQFAATFEEAP